MWDRKSGVTDLGVLLLQETRNQGLVMTLGPKGLIVIDTGDNSWEELAKLPQLHEIKWKLLTDYLPSFAAAVVDSMGAGDALLATMTTALSAGAPLTHAAYLGNCAAAVAVSPACGYSSGSSTTIG